MTPRIRLDHVSFPVSDFETSVEFYRRLLDAETPNLERWRQGGGRSCTSSSARRVAARG